MFYVNGNVSESENKDNTGVFSVSADASDKLIMHKVQMNGQIMMLQEDSGSGHTLMNITEF